MRSFALILAVAFATPLAFGQGQNNYGSIYSRYGVGERLDAGSSQSDMLGGASTALRSNYTVLGNPALWSDETVTSFSAGVGVTGVRASDALNAANSRTTSGDLASMHLSIPLLPSRLGVTVAYRPYSRVNYRSAVGGTLIGESDTTDYTLNQEGSGGLQRLSAGLGLRIGRALQVGASADVTFGAFEYLQRSEFENTAYLETRQAVATRMNGVSATLGAALTARKLRSEEDALTFAGSISLPTKLSGQRTLTLGESLDRDTLAAAVDGEMTLPLVARGGLSYSAGSRWLVAADALYEPWSSFESTLSVGGFDPASSVDVLRDRLRVGGGVEIRPAGRNRNAGLFKRAAYRIGAYRENGLYQPTGTAVSTTALTGGVSFPNRISGARLDFGFEAGVRGSMDGLLVRDMFFRGTATFNFGERWFVRRRIN